MSWVFFLSFKLLRHRHGLPVIAAQSVWKRNNLVVRPPTDLIGKESSLAFFSHHPSSLIRPAAILKSSGLAKQSRSRWWYRRNYFVDHDFFSRKCISAKRRRVVAVVVVVFGGRGLVYWRKRCCFFRFLNAIRWDGWLGENSLFVALHSGSGIAATLAPSHLIEPHLEILPQSDAQHCISLSHSFNSFIHVSLARCAGYIPAEDLFYLFFWIRKEKWGSCLTECNAGSFQPDSLRSSESHHQSNSLK